MLKKGDVVVVYHDPMNCENPEGAAKLLKFRKKDFEQEYWEVMFVDDNFKTARWINIKKH